MTKSKEELLIENAILKSQDSIRDMLKEQLKPITDGMSGLDSRLKVVETDLVAMKETLAPFTAFRTKAWKSLVFTVMGASAVAIILYEVQKRN
jgi:hypothetical protein